MTYSREEREPTYEEVQQTNRELEDLGLPAVTLTEILEIREQMPDFVSDKEAQSN